MIDRRIRKRTERMGEHIAGTQPFHHLLKLGGAKVECGTSAACDFVAACSARCRAAPRHGCALEPRPTRTLMPTITSRWHPRPARPDRRHQPHFLALTHHDGFRKPKIGDDTAGRRGCAHRLPLDPCLRSASCPARAAGYRSRVVTPEGRQNSSASMPSEVAAPITACEQSIRPATTHVARHVAHFRCVGQRVICHDWRTFPGKNATSGNAVDVLRRVDDPPARSIRSNGMMSSRMRTLFVCRMSLFRQNRHPLLRDIAMSARAMRDQADR